MDRLVGKFYFGCLIIAMTVLQSCKMSKVSIAQNSYKNKYVRITGSKEVTKSEYKSKLIFDNGQEYYVEELASDKDLPLSMEDRFKKSFSSYYYHKFFELVHLDPKLSKMFIDSVDVITVQEMSEKTDGKQLFECLPCNAKALLGFKRQLFVYPLTVANSWLEDNRHYDFSYSTSGDYQITKYVGRSADDRSGIYFKTNDGNYSHIYIENTSHSFDQIVGSVKFL